MAVGSGPGAFRQSGKACWHRTAISFLGDAWQAAGNLEEARYSWRQALAILDDLRHPDACGVRAKLHDAGTVVEA